MKRAVTRRWFAALLRINYGKNTMLLPLRMMFTGLPMDGGFWLLPLMRLRLSLPLRYCLESIRNLVEANDSLSFHLADIYRGKFMSQHWIELIAITFCRQAWIHVLDQLTYTPEASITVLGALSIVHDWSCTNMGDRLLRRTVWQNRRAILEHHTL